ncbi:hypothetical protein PG997_011697 [Apiospora hydei]|uniref:C2H2-type domain-containing protein n=1 Tax=Apiospora hydei TaxID=1337664 RepID=A0ABR1VNK5_9PEZI
MEDYSASVTLAQGIDAPPSSKRLKAECFLEHTKIESRELAGEDDTVIVETPGSSLFACPFYLHNKIRYLPCLTRTDLRTIRDLKQHLWTAHRQPYYCPTCSSTFPRASARDQHIKDRTCSLQEWNGPPQGLSEAQLQTLATRCKPGTTETNQWYDIWNLVDTPKADDSSPQNAPWTPYLTGKLESAVCITRDFWAQRGKFVIAEFLEQRNLRDYHVPDEERNLAALYQITLDSVIDQLVQLFKDDDLHVEPNTTMSKLLSSLRNFCSNWV